jgi:hypothetical protein
MTAIYVEIEDEQYEALKKEKERLGLTWRTYITLASHDHLEEVAR